VTARRKGAGGERELATELHAQLGVRLVRRLDQSRAGGHDLEPQEGDDSPVAMVLSALALEVKRHRTATDGQVRQWWAQAAEQAREAGLVPVLAWRIDRSGWRVVVPLSWLGIEAGPPADYAYTATLSVDGFASIVREQIG